MPRSTARIGLPSFVLGLTTTVVVFAGGDRDAPSRQDVAAGRQLYRIYCLGCHGESGLGDGPAATGLAVSPADLTRLAGEAGFDRDEVYASVEGIERTPGHRAPEMPLWGFAFRQFDRDAESRREIRTRIERLVDYLASIQREDDPAATPVP